MTEPIRFLGSFGRALSALGLYRQGHPALQRAIDAAWRDLEALLGAAPRLVFTFLGESVLFGDTPLRGHTWEWSSRLSAGGIQRVQFDAPLRREAFEAFLYEAAARLTHHGAGSDPAGSPGPSGIRYGPVGLKETVPTPAASLPTATLAVELDAELETARWVEEEVRTKQAIPLIEVETIVRSLSVAMHADAQIVLPLVELREFDEYTTTHSLNVSVLGMGLAERQGLDGRAVRAYGVAGLLHDIGKTLIPREILTKPGRFTDAERRVMNQHPADGARLILRSNNNLDLAAVVAFEHHVMIDGGGYPVRPFNRPCHHASRLLHVCDVFDALRTSRPYRDAWPLDDAIGYLRERAGTEFDASLVEDFVGMLKETEPATA